MPKNPDSFDIDTVRYLVGQTANIESLLKELDDGQFGPDFAKAKESAYTLRRYLEIELSQYAQPGES